MAEGSILIKDLNAPQDKWMSILNRAKIVFADKLVEALPQFTRNEAIEVWYQMFYLNRAGQVLSRETIRSKLQTYIDRGYTVSPDQLREAVKRAKKAPTADNFQGWDERDAAASEPLMANKRWSMRI